jgi:hypothetical protein
VQQGCFEVAAFLHHGLLSAPSWRTVVGEAHEAVTAPGELAVEFVQHDVTEQRRQHSPNAKGNFQFERVIVGWRGRAVLDLRRK